MSFGLLGENIQYSYSPLIHKMLGHYSYELVDIKKDMLKAFIKEGNFSGLNITIPFKESILPFVEHDDIVKALGSCNTIYRKDAKLRATNTDFFGFLYLLSYHKIDLSNKNILILGSGGASKTICYIAKMLNAKNIFVATRQNIKKLKNTIAYVNYINYKNLPKDTNVIINTTPLGSQNFIDETPIKDFTPFKDCKYLIDLVYNPYKTKLMYLAEKANINTYNGLAMLVAQATKSAEFFTGTNFLSYNNKIIKLLSQVTQNIILIGMSGSGKTHLGKKLATSLNRPFIDIDDVIEKETNLSIKEIFKAKGETFFREIESKILKRVTQGNGAVISTGAGIIENEANIYFIKAKAITIHINRDITKENFNDIFMANPRPLYPNFSVWEQIYKKRQPVYESISNITIKNEDTTKTLQLLTERINDYYEKTYCNK